MHYNKTFEAPPPEPAPPQQKRADSRDGRVYVWNPEIELAVNVALATGRPLLVRGPSGSGKSSLAAAVALAQEWRYYEEVVSSRTEAQHFLWRFDALRRLSDAQTNEGVQDPVAYVRPGSLWWAFDGDSAARRGVTTPLPGIKDPTRLPAPPSARAVVLIDEIDKADPDVPNNLLVPLGSLEFTCTDADDAKVKAVEVPLVVITTNDERELPNAFLRRCVVATLQRPGRQQLLDIAIAHYGEDEADLYERVADALEQVASAKEKRLHPPSTAEYLDAIGACRELEVQPDDSSQVWREITRAIFLKPATHEEAR